MSESTNCPFCLPNVSSSCFAETDNFRAIYNLAPILPGHCLIVPKKHFSSFLEASDEDISAMIIFSRKIIKTLQRTFGTISYDWTIQEGIAAGQTVEHLHIHIIPRKTNDLPQPGDWYPLIMDKNNDLLDSLKRQKLLPTEMLTIVNRLKEAYTKQK